VSLYRTLQLDVFVFSPCTSTSIRPADAAIQGIMPSATALTIRSAWDQRGNYVPMFVSQRLYRTLQLDIFVF
jgi:hypothetical protein